MALKITSPAEYILVELSDGINYWEIIEAVSKLLGMDEFPQKNVIWIFRQGPLRIQYEDLYKLRDFIVKHCPKNFRGHKTAIVGETEFQAALSKEYAHIVEDLSFEIRVFYEFQSAENWILE